jgi:predicted metal-dependent peptidase
MTTQEKLIKARTLLIMDQTFFGCLAMRLDMVEDSSFETAATDGEKLYYNPQYIDGLSLKQTIGLLAHGVMHCALGHIWRMDSRDGDTWNRACDYTINENLIRAGFTLPDGILNDPQYKDKAAEEIYTILNMKPKAPQNQNGSGQGQGQGQKQSKDGQGQPQDGKGKQQGQGQPQPGKTDPGKCGSIIPAKSKDEAKKTENKWKAAVSQAKTIARGSMPAEFARQIEKVLYPPMPWHTLLRDFIEHSTKNDYSWSRPNARYFSTGLCLPSLISDELPEIGIVIDTSGSIDEAALNRFAQECSNIFEAYDTTIRVLYCDTKVHKEETFTKADLPMSMKPVGGGGTDFRPAFEYFTQKGYAPKCVIYFTDLYGTFPNIEPEFPVMWVTKTKDKEVPFGQVALFEDGE